VPCPDRTHRCHQRPLSPQISFLTDDYILAPSRIIGGPDGAESWAAGNVCRFIEDEQAGQCS
jgi:hypothetical protein